MKTAKRLLDGLKGKRTYILAALAAIYVFGGDQGWWRVSDAVLYLLGFGGIAALRAGIGRGQTTTPK